MNSREESINKQINELLNRDRLSGLKRELRRLERYRRNGVAKYDELQRITELKRAIIDLELENEYDESY